MVGCALLWGVAASFALFRGACLCLCLGVVPPTPSAPYPSAGLAWREECLSRSCHGPVGNAWRGQHRGGGAGGGLRRRGGGLLDVGQCPRFRVFKICRDRLGPSPSGKGGGGLRGRRDVLHEARGRGKAWSGGRIRLCAFVCPDCPLPWVVGAKRGGGREPFGVLSPFPSSRRNALACLDRPRGAWRCGAHRLLHRQADPPAQPPLYRAFPLCHSPPPFGDGRGAGTHPLRRSRAQKHGGGACLFVLPRPALWGVERSFVP